VQKKKSSFPGSLGVVAIAVLAVLLIQAGAGGDRAGTTAVAAIAAGDLLSDPTVPGLEVDTTVTVLPQATDPATTLVTATDPPTTAPPPTDPPTTAPPPTDPPTTAPPPTDPPTTAPPPTDPPTTAPPPTDPPTTAPATTAPVVIGPNTLPPGSTPTGNPPSNPAGGGSVAIGAQPGATSGPAAAFKSAVTTIGSTAATAAERMVLPAVRKLVRLPAVRKLAESQPVAATKKAVALVTEELRDLKPASVVPFLWMALLALLVTTGAFLRLWWAPPDWPSSRSLAVGAHRRAGAQPRQLSWGWPASPRPLPQRAAGGWMPPLPGATGLAARRLPPPRLGIDVDRLREAPPPGKPVFTGQDDAELEVD
jgi:hypothetical protein